MEGVVPGGDGQAAAFNVQLLLGVHGVVHRGVDVQGQLPDGQAGRPLLVGGGPGLDAVFAVGRHVQSAGAAQGDLRAVLTFDDGVLRAVVVRVGLVVVLLRVRQGVHRAVGGHDGHFGGFVAGDGGAVSTGQRQAVQHQHHAGGALLHGDGAVGAAARQDIGPGGVDGQLRAVDLISVIVPLLNGDAAVGEAQRRLPAGGIVLCRQGGGRQHR